MGREDRLAAELVDIVRLVLDVFGGADGGADAGGQAVGRAGVGTGGAAGSEATGLAAGGGGGGWPDMLGLGRLMPSTAGWIRMLIS